jgi:hypothetical protein
MDGEQIRNLGASQSQLPQYSNDKSVLNLHRRNSKTERIQSFNVQSVQTATFQSYFPSLLAVLF